MKIFRAKDGRILQLADKEKMKSWDAEMPLIFIGDTKEKQLPEYRKIYSAEMVKEVEAYLEDLLENVAIPKLIDALTSKDLEIRIKVAENIGKLSESNPDQLKIALPHIEKALKEDPNKIVKEQMQKAFKNYQKAQKRKETAKKRKILTDLRKNMDRIDIEFAEGKISDTDYLKEQKNYLQLKREIELAEQVD